MVFIFIILEIFFRFVIPACNPPQALFDEKTLIYRHKANQKGLFTIGKFAQQTAKYRINNYGWNSPIDYSEKKTKPRIAIIGDSFIEAFQVEPEKAYPSILRKKIGSKYDVYSFGKSGAPLSQYLHISRYVKNTFDPDILVFNVVHNDFDESIHILNSDSYWLTLDFVGDNIIEKTPEPDFSFSQYNWKKRILKKSAILRYLLFNLKINKTIACLQSHKNNEYSANIEVNKIKKNLNLIKISTDYLLKKIKNESQIEKICIKIILRTMKLINYIYL